MEENIIFEKDGNLKRNHIHRCSGTKFLDTFCVGQYKEDYKGAIINIFDFAKNKGARRIFVGGSFIISNSVPRDFDCLIVFNKECDIPDFIDSSVIGEIEFDILFASEEKPKIIDAYLDLFKTEKNGLVSKPIVEVILDKGIEEWVIQYIPNETEKEIIRKTYINRTVIERRKARGVLFTIHGVNTNAYWNSKFAPLACSQGWIFAPFIHNAQKRLLFLPSSRKKVIEQFSRYFYEISKKYQVKNASIIAHSFGTYIIARYLYNHKYEMDLPISIDSIILAGAIVDENYDWHEHKNKIGRILNISSKNDSWVKLMPKWKYFKKFILRDKDGIFGRIGYTGVKTLDDGFIGNREISMLDHCNVFEDEILERVYMPYLNSNVGAVNRKNKN